MQPGPSRATAGPGKPLRRGPVTTHGRMKGGGSVGAVGHVPPPPKKIGLIFFGQLSCKIRAFSGKYHKYYKYHPTIRVCGSVVSSHSGPGAEPRPKMDFIMHISGQKEATWNTLFSIFERWRGPLNVAGPGKLSPLSPLSTGLDAAALMPLLCCGCCCCL